MNRPSEVDVSVVIPTRNRPGMLARALRSVLDQTAQVAEIIVVDDASSVGMETALADFDVARLLCLRHSLQRGASATRNTGIAAARCRYIAFLDDDDTWSPAKIERQLEVFERGDPRIGAVFTYSRKVSPHDPDWSQVARTPSLRLGFEDFLLKTFFGASVPLLRADCLEHTGGFDESLCSVQDRDLWLRIARCNDFAGVPEVLVQNYIHGAQITADLDHKISGREHLLKKYAADLNARPAVLAAHYWRLGLLYCAGCAFEEGRRKFRQALTTDPTIEGPMKDLAWSEREPAEHARHLVEERFNRAGDVVLYY